MEKVTTTEAQKILRERGFEVPYSTIARWAQSGLFEGAERDDSHPRGPLWLIPRKSVLKFDPPKTGRPPKAKTNDTAKDPAETTAKLNKAFREAKEAEEVSQKTKKRSAKKSNV